MGVSGLGHSGTWAWVSGAGRHVVASWDLLHALACSCSLAGQNLRW